MRGFVECKTFPTLWLTSVKITSLCQSQKSIAPNTDLRKFTQKGWTFSDDTFLQIRFILTKQPSTGRKIKEIEKKKYDVKIRQDNMYEKYVLIYQFSKQFWALCRFYLHYLREGVNINLLQPTPIRKKGKESCYKVTGELKASPVTGRRMQIPGRKLQVQITSSAYLLVKARSPQLHFH